jgi:hypothetical protein
MIRAAFSPVIRLESRGGGFDVHAGWTDALTVGAEHLASPKPRNNVILVKGQANVMTRVNLPRRCGSSVVIDCLKDVRITAQDKLEVNNRLHVVSKAGRISLECTVRADSIHMVSRGMISCASSAIETTNLKLKARGIRIKRLSANEVDLFATKGDVYVAAVFATSGFRAVGGGRMFLGSLHLGASPSFIRTMSDLEVGSLYMQDRAGALLTCVSNQGNMFVHVDSLQGECHLAAQLDVKVTCALDALPLQVKTPHHSPDAGAIDAGDQALFTRQSSSQGGVLHLPDQESSNPGGVLVLNSSTASVKVELLSWVETVMRSAGRRK